MTFNPHKKNKNSRYSDYQPNGALGKKGFVPEQDGGWTIRFLKVIEGFNCHDIKKKPDLENDQWVEVIHRNGERSFGPVETFAWGIYDCSLDVRLEYEMPGHRSPAHDILDCEITHFRPVPTPPDNWDQSKPWEFG